MKEQLILTEKQKELVEQFENLLYDMRKENIGIVAESYFDTHYSKRELYFNIFNANEIDELISPDDIDDDEEGDYIAKEDDVIRIEIPIDLKIETSNSGMYTDERYGFIFKNEE